MSHLFDSFGPWRHHSSSAHYTYTELLIFRNKLDSRSLRNMWLLETAPPAVKLPPSADRQA